MQKIRCPHCGVINLEKFITYPQCAGCGSTLPQDKEASSQLPFWRRPVRPMLWVSIVGVLLAGLLWGASALQVTPESESQVVLYGDGRRRAHVGQVIVFNLRLDALAESRAERLRPLDNVKLRIALRSFEKVRFVSLAPQPDEMTLAGRGRYFNYKTLPRDTSLRLHLRVTSAGTIIVPVTAYADGHMAGFWRMTIIARQKP